ncbi:MAG TPA: glycosyltransferase [Solirubrobacterales bacterium]|jgi:hypothetical protein|nr:glycosyltransferase [Solirubrobacterales bacterium]
MRIAVSGMVAGDPHQGGASWAVLQYVLGLKRLGHEVLLVEPVAAGGLGGSASASYLEAVAARFDLEHATLVDPEGESAPIPRDRLRELLADAELLLNVSGMLAIPELLEPIPVRAYLDLDPFFNQHWHLQGADMRFDAHTHFVTVAAGIGGADNEVPTLGFDWIETLPPVVLEEWTPAPDPPSLPFTTIGHWRSYGPIEHDGERYGLRAHSLRELIELPRRTRAEFLLALGIHESERDDLEALERNGWRLADPAEVAATPDRYRDFVRASTAEIGIAKEGYVRSRSGWFSDRSACYLACGRPVVAQDTGFGRSLPLGEGLLAFGTVEEAAGAVEDVLARPDEHRRAARAIAEELLDSDRVLSRLLERLGATG